MKPTIIFTSVIRGAKRGEMHGGIYLLNLNNNKFKCVLDWNDDKISFEGRGGDRGLRGICFHKGKIYIAASNELFALDQKFNIVGSYRNVYLRDCHEISRFQDSIYLSSTATNSILQFDIPSSQFVRGHKFFKNDNKRELLEYNPNEHQYYKSKFMYGGDHINNVFCHNGKVYFSGLNTLRLFAMRIEDRELENVQSIPHGTHNVRCYKGGYLMNATMADSVIFINKAGKTTHYWPVKKYPTNLLSGTEYIGTARQGFGRGLCVAGDTIIAGSSPATISTYDFKSKGVRTIMILNDIRNAIHGLEVWPFQTPSDLL